MVPLQTGRPPRFKLYIKQKSLSLLKGFVLGFLSGWSRFLPDDLHTLKQKSLSLLKGFLLGFCRDGPASCGTTSMVANNKASHY